MSVFAKTYLSSLTTNISTIHSGKYFQGVEHIFSNIEGNIQVFHQQQPTLLKKIFKMLTFQLTSSDEDF